MSNEDFTIMVRNLPEKANEELLYELFLQAGPIESVRIPSANGVPRNFGFIVFKHEVSVPYAMQLFDKTLIYGRSLSLNTRSRCNQERRIPVMHAPVHERIGSRKEDPPPPPRAPTSAMGKRLLDKSMMPSGPSRSKFKKDEDLFADPWAGGAPFNYPSQKSNLDRSIKWKENPQKRRNQDHNSPRQDFNRRNHSNKPHKNRYDNKSNSRPKHQHN